MENSNPAGMDEKYFEIVRIITNDNAEVMEEIKEGFIYPQKYIEKHYEHLSQDYMLNDKEIKNYTMDKWRLMVDLLEQHNFVCIRDWKDELQDFLYFLFQTKRAVSENLEKDKLNLNSILSEEGNLSQWSGIIDEKLTDKNLVIGHIDTDSDQYTLFLCTRQELASLKECASSVGHIISYAKEA